ncbi:hypothetical protein J1N35_010339 [Gossypium stocksii]|uniref:Zinc knuckle CX2CX4HX4C domain-containing protein n=1 Tax=Gossypium stocksii TaxID=47602 RepID=A0A9D3W063_9ROSI|nr:hypothetical protein J1N35_010339 [Gossypium stocksii]
MYVRVKLDVRNPLKRRKKFGLPQKEQVYIRFQYEKLSMFCFLCCRLGHNGSFCRIRIVQGKKETEMDMGRDISLMPMPRRASTVTSCWLREEGVGNPNASSLQWQKGSGVRDFLNQDFRQRIHLGLNLEGRIDLGAPGGSRMVGWVPWERRIMGKKLLMGRSGLGQHYIRL